MKAQAKGADERLLVEAAQADPARFADLYESHFERVYAFIADVSGTGRKPRISPRRSSVSAARKEFKKHLRADVQRRAKMTGTTVSFIREGFHTVTPYLIVNGAAGVLEFARQALGAQEILRVKRPDGGITHAEFRVGDSIIEIGDANEQFPPIPCAIHLKVENVDAVYERAIRAAATPLFPLADQEYGECAGGVKDFAGNHWYIGSPLGETHFLPDQRSVTPYMQVEGAPRCIEFLKQAFQAEEVMRHQTPDGTVRHAKIRIGDSVLEMGEAHEPFPAMPLNLHLYVPDTDGGTGRPWRQARFRYASRKTNPMATVKVECAIRLAMSGGSRRTLEHFHI